MVAPEVHRRDEGVAASRTLTEVAVGIVQRSDGQYLLTTRPQGKAYAGYWEFPGGKLEAQESVVAALRRELKEEINITIADAEMVRTDVVDYPHALVRLHFCLITQWSGEIQMREQQTFAWSDLPTALSPILPGTVPVLAWLATVGKLPKS
ncbi:MAG: (deoxy)nucleoside triphosphate pyrophosphohydrolase [Burkholderiaceae bacterium]|nr:(deoxy)nucleoside triphosphate pyrophosphohydrolase [Burkholderiaceae bacterium]